MRPSGVIHPELVSLLASAGHGDRIVLTDASDVSLAAALVAAKLLIPLGATADATASGEANAVLIAQLADAYTPSA